MKVLSLEICNIAQGQRFHFLEASTIACDIGECVAACRGLSPWPVITSGGGTIREHVTIGWGPLVTVIDEEYWYNANVWGEEPLLFMYKEDPSLEKNLAGNSPEMCDRMLRKAVEDAGGEIPEAFEEYKAMPGCTPYVHLA